ncbi:tyrosine-type recombinase/integrase [Pedobacter sp. L105]|uniref:tyrosine-type recombinase/integrase n=1 Tax=Pedobacter sp. L105 TaxID=1641871 RepID=UPI00131AEDDC|nr:tyrosine-type recombinase/integrase [Pedobacter sp. L105]
MEELKEYLQSRCAPGTVKIYQRDIEIYQHHCPKAEQAGYQEVLGYIGQLRSRYKNPKTIRRILSALKAYYDYLNVIDQRKDNPTAAIRLRDQVNNDIQLQDFFTPAELEQLLEKEERYALLSARNRILMSLLIYQGLQPREAAGLKISDLNLITGTVYIRSQANTNSRTLSLKPGQILLFHDYLNETRKLLLKDAGSDQLLIGLRGGAWLNIDIIEYVIRQYKGLFHPRKVNCKSIRGSVITNLLKAGNELRAVQVFAGHKKISSTEKYQQSQVEILHNMIQSQHPMK